MPKPASAQYPPPLPFVSKRYAGVQRLSQADLTAQLQNRRSRLFRLSSGAALPGPRFVLRAAQSKRGRG